MAKAAVFIIEINLRRLGVGYFVSIAVKLY